MPLVVMLDGILYAMIDLGSYVVPFDMDLLYFFMIWSSTQALLNPNLA